MRHPFPDIGSIEEYVDRITRWDHHGILPDEIFLSHSVLIDHEKSLSMEMDRMLHGVRRIGIVEYLNLDHVSFFEIPVYIVVFFLGIRIDNLPERISRV